MVSAESQEGEDQDVECPVCYERFTDSERRLSCGHIFCHDCLVKTLVSASRDSLVIRGIIICPICRHVTFIAKLPALEETTSKCTENGQTLEVPASPPPTMSSYPSDVHDAAGFGPTNNAHSTYRGLVRYFGWVSTRWSRSRLNSPNSASQIFIISNQGRPMTDEDAISMVASTLGVPNPRPHMRRRLCTSPRCLLSLLLLISVLALVAATLPWIILG